MPDTDTAASFAIQIARDRGLAEIGPDELLLGCFQSMARFGILTVGSWTFDLESFGIDWMRSSPAKSAAPKVSYSQAAVIIFDRAAQIARLDRSAEIRVEHMLVAFADEQDGLMGELRRTHGIESKTWRAAAAAIHPEPSARSASVALPAAGGRDYLTPEEAAESLGIHVQTLRAYVRSGKLPALRLAGERSLRILRADLNKVLEPLVPENQLRN